MGGPAIGDKETSRVEAFSDGVFAIAMTLLVLEFKVPPLAGSAVTNRTLLRALLDLWPSFLAFVLSFGTILIMWVNHHELFKYAHRVTRGLLFANGFLLLIVTLVPFPTAVLAAYLDEPAANTAATFYCATYVLVSIAYHILGHAVMHSRSALPPSPPHERRMARIHRVYRAGTAVYLLATLVAAFHAFSGLAICGSLWFFWLILDYSPKLET